MFLARLQWGDLLIAEKFLAQDVALEMQTFLFSSQRYFKEVKLFFSVRVL